MHDLEYYQKYVRKHIVRDRNKVEPTAEVPAKHVCKRQGQGPKRNKYIAHRAPKGSSSRRPTNLGQRVEQAASYQDGLEHVTVQDKVQRYRWGDTCKRAVLGVGARVARINGSNAVRTPVSDPSSVPVSTHMPSGKAPPSDRNESAPRPRGAPVFREGWRDLQRHNCTRRIQQGRALWDKRKEPHTAYKKGSG